MQRRAVGSALRNRLGEVATSHIFINTAEKAQGKTAELVIVCYGVVSPAQLDREASFLFTPNRLNVALSRSRCKFVIVCGECLQKTRLKMLEAPSVQEGYALFMKALAAAKDGEQGAFFEWDAVLS